MVKKLAIFLIVCQVTALIYLYYNPASIRIIKVTCAATVLTFIYLECSIVFETLRDRYNERQRWPN